MFPVCLQALLQWASAVCAVETRLCFARHVTIHISAMHAMTSSTDTPTEPVTRGTNYSKPNKVGRKQKSNVGSACFLLLTVLTLRLFLADTCTICGISAVHARCATCLQRLCLKCDKLYHSHPDRKGHNRTITTPAKTSRWEEKPSALYLAADQSQEGHRLDLFTISFVTIKDQLCLIKTPNIFAENQTPGSLEIPEMS